MAAAVLLAAVGCAPRPTSGAQDISAVSLLPAGTPRPRRVGDLELLGAFELRSGDADFGGISAARSNGAVLHLLSDRSTLFDLGWPEHADVQDFSATLLAKRRLIDAGGQPLDAEALVLDPDGDVLIGDETTARVVAFAPGKSAPKGEPVQLPRAFADGGVSNTGLETLARLPDGTLLAIVEGAAPMTGLHAVALFDEGGLRTIDYQAADGFQVTDADAASGWLFVLERRLSLIGGWQSRIVAVTLDQNRPIGTSTIAGRELARISGPVLGENYEAISVRSGAGDTIDIVLVADGNFSPLQRTQLLELRWRP